MKTTQGITYTRADGTVVDLETQTTALETSTAANTASVAEHTGQIAALRTDVDKCYSPTNLPTRGTVENGNEFNPFRGYAGEAWINGDNGTGQVNPIVNIGDGARESSPTDHKLAIVRCEKLALYRRMANDHVIAIAPTADEINAHNYDIGQILMVYTNDSLTAPPGQQIYPFANSNAPNVYSFAMSPGSTSFPGTWISLGMIEYTRTGSSARLAMTQRIA